MQEYNPSKIEPKWQKYWEENKQNEAVDNDKRPKFYCLDMFPYPSGDGLHIGHLVGYISTDIYSRYMRMNGRNVLHPMGWDAFGLPAENYAIKKGIHPKESTKINTARFREQLKSIGFSYDWTREINTSDPSYYKWSQWFFIQLYNNGLAYQKDAPVNWCPNDQTVLANEQVKDGKCERCGHQVEQKNLKQWFFKVTDYADRLLDDTDKLDWPESIKSLQKNWIGKSDGSIIDFKLQNTEQIIKVFTTRADTLFGCTYIVLSPEHELISKLKPQISNFKEVEKYISQAKEKSELERTGLEKVKTGVKLAGLKAINPINNEKVDIWIADYVLDSYGTGAVMAVPAHDDRDYVFAKKYKINIKEVIIPKVIDKNDPPRDGVKTIFRNAVQVILINPKDNKVLVLKWKKFPWSTFITGGIENGEDTIAAAKREIVEETGYTNTRYIRTLGGPVESHFYASHKGVNRKAHFSALIFETVDNTHNEISDEEKAIHECSWMTWDELRKDKNIKCAEYEIWLKRLDNLNYAFTNYGILKDSAEFTGLTSEDAKKKITEELFKKNSGNFSTNYHLRDWLVSRQRYWGSPIPIVYCDKCGTVTVPEKDLPVGLPDDIDFKPKGKSPLASSDKFVNTKCPKCGGKAARETDTMDGFVDNSWYYYRFCDPNNDKQFAISDKLKYWMPVDLYIGGAEHAVGHLLYSRFFTKFLFDKKYIKFSEPFTKLINQGLILASDGRKMSKSLGNVINPDKVIEEYGADVLRLYEMFMGPLTDAKPWNMRGIVGIKRFLDRVWNIILVKSNNVSDDRSLQNTIKKVTEDINNLFFNTAISAIMIYINDVSANKSANNNETKQTLLKIISPFAPHFAEELWNQLGNKKSIFTEKWPKYKEVTAQKFTIPVQINGKVRGTIIVSAIMKEDQVFKMALKLENVKKWLKNKCIKKHIYVSGKIISIVL